MLKLCHRDKLLGISMRRGQWTKRVVTSIALSHGDLIMMMIMTTACNITTGRAVAKTAMGQAEQDPNLPHSAMLWAKPNLTFV